MEKLQLSTREVLNHTRQIEFPNRCKETTDKFADEVIRYGSFVGSSIECHASLERAMDHARFHIDTTERGGRSVESGRVILAGSLSGSKGRFVRSWHAPDGGLWGCLIHADTLMPQSSMLLSLAVGVAACETIRQIGINNAALRWVNDVLVDGAKVAGFLIESHSGPVNGEQFHLIGFGINVNNRNFPTELVGTATSLCDVLGRPFSLKSFALDFLAKLVWNIGLLYYTEARQSDWITDPYNLEHPVIKRWKLLSDSLGKRVSFGYDVIEKPQFCGVVTGICSDGGLQMTMDDGTSITEHSGEIRYI